MYFKDTVNNNWFLFRSFTPFEDKRRCTTSDLFSSFLELSAKKTKLPQGSKAVKFPLGGVWLLGCACSWTSKLTHWTFITAKTAECFTSVSLCKWDETFWFHMQRYRVLYSIFLLTLTMFNKSSLVLNIENVLNKSISICRIKNSQPTFLDWRTTNLLTLRNTS